MFGVRIWMNGISKRQNDNNLVVFLDPCPKDQTRIKEFIKQLILLIVPNIPNLNIRSANTACQFTVSSSDPPSSSLSIGAIIGIVIGVVVFLIIFTFILYKLFTRSPIRHLPPEVRWSFEQYENFSYSWEFSGSSSTGGYYFKTFPKRSEEFQHVMELFHTFDPGEIQVKAMTLVYNRVLIANFVGSFLIQSQRNKTSPELFKAKKGLQKDRIQDHDYVQKKYDQLVQKYSYNKNLHTHIIPACHGTELTIAEKICATGFASLSSLDAGFFGKGIYFSTHLQYCLPYFASRRNPAVLISWVLPGNTYPLIESHMSPQSLIGAAMKNGFNSHYVVTNKKGESVCAGTEVYDEIVIPQEAQIVPAIILEIDETTLSRVAKDWMRTTPKDTPIAPRVTVFDDASQTTSDGYISLQDS